ncbi:MAG: hypothetical protein A2138_26925 [Deltaproteobacteria bacterium RBG_16_71_12]|nr:MAG: hypothetical protein A2138_26925 [Deltaproteobacteria bacterium RBG_16_71_12]
MPNACNYTWSTALDTVIREESRSAGVPLDLAYTFVAVESGFDPLIRNLSAIEDSVGLLQLNRRGGQGQGYSVAQLQDPRFNLQVGLPPIRRSYELAWAPDRPPFDFIYAVAVGSGHPGPIARADPRMTRIMNAWICFSAGVGQVGPDGAPGAAFVPAPAESLAQFMASYVTLFMFPGGILRGLTAYFRANYWRRKFVYPFTPAFYARRFSAAFDPRRLDPQTRLRHIFDPRIRRPPGHRPPRGFPR